MSEGGGKRRIGKGETQVEVECEVRCWIKQALTEGNVRKTDGDKL